MKNQNGFTLIEVLVAVVLLAVISFLIFQGMGTSAASKDRFEKREGAFRSASLALDRLSRDLTMTVLYSDVEMLGLSSSAEQMTKSVFIGVNNGDQDKLTFETFSHIRYLKDSKESDLAEVSYFLEPQTEEEEESRGNLYALKKREASPPDAEPEEGGSVITLLEGVKELNLRYYDLKKVEFSDEWDSTKVDYLNKLPDAVEISLVMQDPIDPEGSIPFSTIVLLEMAPGPNDIK